MLLLIEWVFTAHALIHALRVNHQTTSRHVFFKMSLLKRRLLVLLFLLGLFCFLNLIYSYYEDKVIINFFRSVPSVKNQDTAFGKDDLHLSQHLSRVRREFKMTLDQYETSGGEFGNSSINAFGVNTSFYHSELYGEMFKLYGKKTNTACRNALFLLIQVHSSPENFMSRKAIRLSWGNMKNFIGKGQQSINSLR